MENYLEFFKKNWWKLAMVASAGSFLLYGYRLYNSYQIKQLAILKDCNLHLNFVKLRNELTELEIIPELNNRRCSLDIKKIYTAG